MYGPPPAAANTAVGLTVNKAFTTLGSDCDRHRARAETNSG
jgi:hypothetical protein